MYSLRRICLSVQTECTQFQNKGQRSSSLPGPTYFTLKVAKSQKHIFSLVPSSKKSTKSLSTKCSTYHEKCLRPRICAKYFLSFPQKNLQPEKIETNYVFTLQFLNYKIYSLTKKSHLALGKIGVLLNFYHLKIEK